MSTQNSEEQSQESMSSTLEEDTSYTTKFDDIDYQQPPNPKEMERIYGKGYEFTKQLGYSGKYVARKNKVFLFLYNLIHKKQKMVWDISLLRLHNQ